MRYVIIDVDGASRGHFPRFSELLQVVADVRRDHPEMVDELYVLKYGDAGERVGDPMPARSLLPPDDVAKVSVSTGPACAYDYDERLQPA